MAILSTIVLLLVQIEFLDASYCYNIDVGINFYCPSSCSGSYSYQYCSYNNYYYNLYYYYNSYYYNSYYYNYYYYYYDDSYKIGLLSVGAFVGVLVGSIVSFVLLVGCLIAISKSCTKSAGTTGRVVYPINQSGIAVVNSSTAGQHYTTPSAPPLYQYSNMYNHAYPPPNVVHPAPSQSYATGSTIQNDNHPMMTPIGTKLPPLQNVG